MRRFLKSISLLITILLLLSLVGCGSTASTTDQIKKDSKPQNTASQKEPSKNTTVSLEQKQKPSTPITEKKTQVSSQINQPKKETPAIQQPSKPEKPKAATTVEKPAPASKNQTKQPVETKPITKAPVQKPISTVTITIVGPKDHKNILAAEKVNIKDGDTIYDVLLSAAKKHGIQVESRGSGSTAYVEGIDNIYEFDYGVKSGWIFKQNGTSLTRSVGTTKVKSGDQIQCLYTE